MLDEVLERVRRRRGVAGIDRISIPLIVAVTKSDVWAESLGQPALPDDMSMVDYKGKPSIDMEQFTAVSDRVRTWLKSHCPEMVHAAESQVQRVFFVPTSSQGTSPELNAQSKMLMVRPSTMQPRMADAPLLLALHYAAPRLLPAARKDK